MIGMLAYPENNYFRPCYRTQEVLAWAESRGVPMVPSKNTGAPGLNWDEVQAFWFPMDVFHDFTGGIPDHVRVIIDYDSPKQDKDLKRILSNRAVGVFRAFSFFRPSGLNIEMESFYWHMPKILKIDSRADIVFVDTSREHPAIRHSQILNTLCLLNDFYPAICSLTGKDIKFYLTGFNPLSAYQEAILALGRHFPSCKPLENIEKNLLPFAMERTDYEAYISRARLFITDQPDLADIGLFEMVMNNVPVAVVPLCSLFSNVGTLTYSMSSIADDVFPGFNNFIDTVNQSILRFNPSDMGGLFASSSGRIQTDFATDIFYQSWDDMWEWAAHGSVKYPYQKFLKMNAIRSIDTVEELREEIGRFQAPICFFGGSGRFLKVVASTGNGFNEISCVFDNSEAKWGSSLAGITIRPPGKIAEVNPSAIFVTTNAAADVVRQVLDYKIRYGLRYEIFIVNDLDVY